ncbi:MAG: hypothetical protein FWD83_00275 [Promicromonosporaceae bacterium]|nr:hypothetical protein [Promicromonosporaceae bacterium]
MATPLTPTEARQRALAAYDQIQPGNTEHSDTTPDNDERYPTTLNNDEHCPTTPGNDEEHSDDDSIPRAVRIGPGWPQFKHEDPGVVNWLDAELWQIEALLERAERFAEWASRIWRLPELTPCWRLHPDVVVAMSDVERAWTEFHRGKDTSAPGLFRRRLEDARDWWRSSMVTCTATRHEPPIAPPAENIDARRVSYASNPDVHATFTWPALDEAGRPYNGIHLINDGRPGDDIQQILYPPGDPDDEWSGQ